MRPTRFRLLPAALAALAFTACAPARSAAPLVPALVPAVVRPAPVLPGPGEVRVRADGTILVDQQPFFPFGFYHLSWAATPAQRQRDVRALGAAGFNTLTTEAIDDQDLATYDTFLEDARAAGVKVVPYGFSLQNIKRFGRSPAVLGWKVADDSNAQTTPQEIRKRVNEVRSASPDRLTYISLSVGYNRREPQYFGVADAVGNQSYPIGDDDINVVYPVMRITVEEALRHGNVPIANLQTFSWNDLNGRGGNWPTPQEITNMTYQALSAGVKGVVYYAYRGPEAALDQHPDLWNATKRLAQEVRVLAPALSDGRRDTLAVPPRTPLLATVWTYGGRRTLVVVNTSRTRNVTLNNFPVPGGTPGLRPMFEGRARTLALQNGTLSGTLGPLDVQVYCLC